MFADLCNALYFHGRQVIKPEDLISQENDVSTLIGKESITNGNEKISRYRQKSKYQWRVYLIIGVEHQKYLWIRI